MGRSLISDRYRILIRLSEPGRLVGRSLLIAMRPEEDHLNILDALFGRPLATEEEKAERIGPLRGIPIFGLDALSSAAMVPKLLSLY